MTTVTSKGQHVPESSVVERRLRPIYDWLDIGNNKKALQECEKVLKKTPNLQCAKALKALTLHRIGKEVEADGILTNLTSENPTDDATLQAMTLCYRELQQPEQICKIYETALKHDPGNEELITHLFMSYARIFDFKSQQKTALALYKQKPKTPYYCWAVMSLVLQATRGEGKSNPKQRQLLLSLAHRMMEKLILDGKLEAEQEVQLFVLVLELEGDYNEIMNILNGPMGTKLACTHPNQARLKYLAPLNKWAEINTICKAILVESVDRWDIWKEYVNSVFKLMSLEEYRNGTSNNDNGENGDDEVDDTPEKCHEFICRVVENGADNGFLLRGPYLARFELCSKLENLNQDTTDVLGETIELFIEYFRKFGHKPCCVSDLRIYLNLLDDLKKRELSKRLISDVGISSTSVPQTEQQMQRHLCALQLSRLCGAHRHLPAAHLQALVTAFALHYQHGYQTFGTNLLSTDLGPSDPYALLAAHVLYDLARVENSSDPIVAALVLLESVLKNSPSNFHAKLLCVRLYHTVGGTIGAQNMYNSLDTKHLQLDSLGFIHCARLATTGSFWLSANLFDATLKFFASNYKDSSDHITFSYKFGSFIKLDEFMDFRERLNNSIHYTAVAIDRIVLSLLECTNLDGLLNLDISPKDDKIDWDALRDNHDLSVYVTWDPERIDSAPEDCPEIHDLFKQDLLFLKLRSSILWSLAAGVNIINLGDSNEKKHIEHLVKVLVEWETLWRDTNRKSETYVQQNLRQDLVTLPLPSRLHVALEIPQFEIIGNLFEILLGFAMERYGKIDEMAEKFEAGLKTLLEDADDRAKDQTKNSNLIRRRETLEFFVNIVEVLSISSLVCLLCNELVKPSQGKKGKKKLADSTTKTIVNKLGRSLKTHINQFYDILQSWSTFIVLSNLPAMLEPLNLNNSGPDVIKNIVESYSSSCQEMQTVLKSKLKMLNSVS